MKAILMLLVFANCKQVFHNHQFEYESFSIRSDMLGDDLVIRLSNKSKDHPVLMLADKTHDPKFFYNETSEIYTFDSKYADFEA